MRIMGFWQNVQQVRAGVRARAKSAEHGTGVYRFWTVAEQIMGALGIDKPKVDL